MMGSNVVGEISLQDRQPQVTLTIDRPEVLSALRRKWRVRQQGPDPVFAGLQVLQSAARVCRERARRVPRSFSLSASPRSARLRQHPPPFYDSCPVALAIMLAA